MLTIQNLHPRSCTYFILGTTASGKSSLASELSKAHPISVVNADGMQALNALPILTASPNQAEKHTCPHFLYNYFDFSKKYIPTIWLEDLKNRWEKIISGSRIPLLVGGYKSYFLLFEKCFSNDFRNNLNPLIICPPKEKRDAKIAERTHKMLEEGLLAEGENFFQSQSSLSMKYGINNSVGFKKQSSAK